MLMHYEDVIHGDIGMHAIDPVHVPPEVRAALEKRSGGTKVTLAVGEATGHAHVLTSDAPMGYLRVSDTVAYVLLDKAGLLDHTGTAPGEGHGQRVMAPGYYEVPTERRYDPTEYERRVVD